MPSHPEDIAGPSRDRIIELLRWEALTVDELARHVGLSVNGVRAQLASLERDGLVMRAGVRQTGTVGKPAVVFSLTEQAEQDLSAAYPVALAALVSSLRDRLGADDLVQLLGDAGASLASGTAARRAGDVLEALGTKVRSTPTPNGGERIEGAGCPLATAVSREPATCELVRSLLAASLGRVVEMRCHHGTRPRCCFEVAAPAA